MFTTYDLLNDVADLRNWFDGFFNDRPYLTARADYPYVNLYEKDDNIEIAVIAPGIKGEDIDLELINNRLNIEIEKKSDYADKAYIRRERDFGKFKKVVELPYRVDPNRIEASMKDGILTIKLNRSEETKPKKIEIQ